ncbi:MAG: excinuclease ABC subunit UvrC [Candidatus Marinimicrobia bacterium]|nr:excinuclease ABC subunit UvrC [Candidatus Neomarinimicrobiota bacterium]MBL6826474.1 excinuclease ABC subunit UvrC [Candidatus Neomarinimicrobiota bacterium]
MSIQSKILGLPKQPGIYQFKDKNGKIIYIGKAKNLKNRVKSYFQKKSYRTPKEQSLLKRIEDFEWIVCQDEADAFITEATLIKKFKPKYNVQLKDDKSFPYLKITNEQFPKVFITRKIFNDKSKYFGPYTDVKSMRRLVDVLYKAFPVRNCYIELNEIDKETKQPLVLKNGLGIRKITENEYQDMVADMISFLKGETKAVEKKLSKQMDYFTSKMMYEDSARVRDQIKSINSFKVGQRKLEADFSNRDVIGYQNKDKHFVVVILRIREGRILSREKISLDSDESLDNILRSIVINFYMNAAYIPNKIYFPELPEESKELEFWLSEKAGRKVVFYVPERAVKLQELKLANRNAKLLLNEWLLNIEKRKDYIPKLLNELKDILNLNKPPRLIEAFDISHLGGTDTVASMVVFKDGRPFKSAYRKYSINVDKVDDFESMREVVYRRYKRQLKEKNTLPDLVLIDGGKGQLSAAIESLRELKLDLPTVALAKRLEELFLPSQKDSLRIAKNSPALNILKQLRDEAHRFAVTFQRQKRTKGINKSKFEDIPGVGKKTVEKIYKRFQNTNDMKDLSDKALSYKLGISQKIAKKIKEII